MKQDSRVHEIISKLINVIKQVSTSFSYCPPATEKAMGSFGLLNLFKQLKNSNGAIEKCANEFG
jgi:hypothetical protein